MTTPTRKPDPAHAAAAAVRDACLRAALDGYERAGLSGLCEEGRWEMVVDAIRSLDIDALVADTLATGAANAGAAETSDTP